MHFWFRLEHTQVNLPSPRIPLALCNMLCLIDKEYLIVSSVWTLVLAQNLSVMKTLKNISILLVVASTLLSSCSLLVSSPLVSYHNDDSDAYFEDTYWDYDLSACQFPNCSCTEYVKACRCTNTACKCGHTIDYHFIQEE